MYSIATLDQFPATLLRIAKTVFGMSGQVDPQSNIEPLDAIQKTSIFRANDREAKRKKHADSLPLATVTAWQV